jgi:hypothetical protein
VLTCGLISRALKKSSAQLVTTVQPQQKEILVAAGTDQTLCFLYLVSQTFNKRSGLIWSQLLVSSAGTIAD